MRCVRRIVRQLARDSNLKTLALPGMDYAFLRFNLRDPANRNRPHPLFADRTLRRAITMSLNRETLVRSVLDTFARGACWSSGARLFNDGSAWLAASVRFRAREPPSRFAGMDPRRPRYEGEERERSCLHPHDPDEQHEQAPNGAAHSGTASAHGDRGGAGEPRALHCWRQRKSRCVRRFIERVDHALESR